MHTIAAMNLLLRERAELPEGFNLPTEEFHEGWNFSRSAGAGRLKRRLLSRGWNFIKIDGGAQRSGVGDTAQEAIASALKLALRHICEHFNAVEVEHIELTQYPWFFLARVKINPYCIQQSAMLPWPDHLEPASHKPGWKRLQLHPSVLCPHSCSTTPLIREMLISSRSAPGRIQ